MGIFRPDISKRIQTISELNRMHEYRSVKFQQFRKRKNIERKEEGRGVGCARGGSDDSYSFSLQLGNFEDIGSRGDFENVRTI
jgi:hypothetical protein